MIVLKIILGILLAIILFVLILLLYLLLAPIGYDIRGQWDGSRDVRFRIHDLLHIVSVKVAYKLGEGLSMTVKLIGLFKVMNMQPGEEGSDKDIGNEGSKDSPDKSSDDVSSVSPDDAGDNEPSSTPDDNAAQYISSSDHSSYENEPESKETDLSPIEEPGQETVDKRFHKPESPYEVNYRDTGQDINRDEDMDTAAGSGDGRKTEPPASEDKDSDSDDKKSDSDTNESHDRSAEESDASTDASSSDDKEDDQDSNEKKKSPEEGKKDEDTGIMSYLTRENADAVKYMIACVLKLIKKLLPHVSRIDGTYSIGSPDVTGQVFGVLTLMPALYKRGNSIIPDFESEKAYFDGEIEARGKVVLGWFVALVLKVLLHRDSRRLIFKIIKNR